MSVNPPPAAGREARPAVRDAATLILLDESGPVPKVLMGRRSAALLFMPGKHVFPGGRVEPADLRAARDVTLPPAVAERLLARNPARFSARRAAALGLAAIRETFEETGIGVDAGAPLLPVARAITPPGGRRRYDTRFFVVSAEAARVRCAFENRPDRELDEAGWFALDALDRLDLAAITRQVIADVEPRLRDGSWRDASVPMPFYRARRGRFTCERI